MLRRQKGLIPDTSALDGIVESLYKKTHIRDWTPPITIPASDVVTIPHPSPPKT